MALYKLLLPKMGESVSEATITKWLKQPGDMIEEDDTLLEIATDKVDSEVPAPVKGILKEQLYAADQTVQVGEVIAIIEIEGDAESNDFSSQSQETSFDQSVPSNETLDLDIPGVAQLVDLSDTDNAHNTFNDSTNRFYSPLVKNIARHEGLSPEELDQIQGTGAEGRVTKEDILSYVANRNLTTKKDVMASVENTTLENETSQATQPPVTSPATYGTDEIIEMDRMRRLISDHMVKSVQISPHVCSFVEADVTNLVLWRNKVKDAYKQREGENITFTPLFIEAISKALKDFPLVNISIDGYNIIKKRNINIGMAAALPNGNLIVPVIKNADQLSLVGLSKTVNDLAQRSRANKLKPDDTQDGTFTFTNIGAFGNIMGTPIINQPQAAILAVGAITKKPAVIETEYGDMIGIRHMMYLSLSYDHRAIDGALGGTFLKRVADYLENWDSNRVI